MGHNDYPLVNWHSYWTLWFPIVELCWIMSVCEFVVSFSHENWWCSILMLVYQRVMLTMTNTLAIQLLTVVKRYYNGECSGFLLWLSNWPIHKQGLYWSSSLLLACHLPVVKGILLVDPQHWTDSKWSKVVFSAKEYDSARQNIMALSVLHFSHFSSAGEY